MLVVRNVFRLKYGHAKPAVAAMKESLDMMKRAGIKSPVRMLTDLTGPAYTLVLENTYQNLQEFEAEGKQVMGNPEFGAWYHDKFVPHVDSGYREIMTVVE
jgi:hypothetical protein